MGLALAECLDRGTVATCWWGVSKGADCGGLATGLIIGLVGRSRLLGRVLLFVLGRGCFLAD